MKNNNLILFAILIFFVTNVFANEGNNEKGSYPQSFINLGGGIGTPFWNKTFGETYKFKNSIPLNPTFTFERKLGVGGDLGEILSDFTTVGTSVTYSRSELDYHYYGYDYKLTFTGLYISGRTSFHILKHGPFDPYVGVGFGYVIVTAKATSEFGGTATGIGTSGFDYAAYAGLRFMPTRNFGFFGEIGYSPLSIFNAGITFGFN